MALLPRLHWMYIDEEAGNAQVGPVLCNRVKALFGDGTIKLGTYMWANGMKEWQKLKDIPDLLRYVEESLLAAEETPEHESGLSGGAEGDHVHVQQEGLSGNLGSKEKSKRTKRSRKRQKRGPSTRVSFSGFPADASALEIGAFFSKMGILKKKGGGGSMIYLERDENGDFRGSGTATYARRPSVDNALLLLDGAIFRGNCCISVREYGDDSVSGGGKRCSDSKPIKPDENIRKMRRMMENQALAWDEGEYTNRGLCILVLRHVFEPSKVAASKTEVQKVENFVATGAQNYGGVEKITMFSSHPDGIVVVKFSSGFAAEAYRSNIDGVSRIEKPIVATYWDGVEDFDNEKTVQAEMKRIDEFGKWLETEEIPDDLRVEDASS